MILPCTCTSEYQDKQYGPGRRVHNRCGRERVKERARCTVCSKVRDILKVRTAVRSKEPEQNL